MPVGIQRLNAAKSQPSSQIVFIKPLPGPNCAYAQDFLERIAAICHPIMKANHLSIMTLEEYEPNREFMGRNFNAGEIIQLVLRAPNSRNWLSFKTVQMVMIHELAHCQQMNHGRDFWKVNNRLKTELRELWAKNYTGDGLWGRGQTLLSGEYDDGRKPGNEIMPVRSLCGGTFRSRRRKRKRVGNSITKTREEETYAEAKQRRIAKKFGSNGAALGGDEETRVKLEYGQKVKGKPRVANSARGRELRVAAAAARFGQQKQDGAEKKEARENEEHVVCDECESEDDECEDLDNGGQAVNLDGSQMLDGEGHGMIRVCMDDDQDDGYFKEEMNELQELDDANARKPMAEEAHIEPESAPLATSDNINPVATTTSASPVSEIPVADGRPASSTPTTTSSCATSTSFPAEEIALDSDLLCPICSLSNDLSSLRCIACSHVLNTSKVTGFWRCQSVSCKGSEYINAADCGICGVCGARRDK